MSLFLTNWSIEIIPIFFVLLLLGFYLSGALSSKPKNIKIVSWWRITSYIVGNVILVFALFGPLDYLSEKLFFFHMIQHLAITHLAVPLLLLGAPTFTIIRGMPYGIRYYTIGKLANNYIVRSSLNFVSKPPIAWTLFVTSFWLWHIPGLYSRAVLEPSIHILEHSMFLLSAMLFWGVLIDPTPFRSAMPYLTRMFFVVLALTQGLPLAAFLTFARDPLYSVYMSNSGIIDVSPLVDQQIGGLIMWIGTMVPYFITLGGVFWMAVNEDKR